MRLLSVVVTITSGEDHLPRCLGALSAQRGAPPMEIVVPVYPSLENVAALRGAWPDVRFVEIPEPPPSHPGLEHWQYDRRRAIGLRAVQGDIVAMTEDHAIPDANWCAKLWDAHGRLPHGVIGGGIAYAGAGPLNRALFYCDFIRYQPPFPAAAAVEYVSDVDVSYKRPALESCRETWRDFYHETAVHGRLRAAGETLYLTPEFAVGYDRGRVSLPRALRQRFIWARVFAGRRAQETGGLKRLAYALLSPGLTPLLLLRKLNLLRGRRQPLGPFFAALPFTFLCLLFWSIGEFVGSATAQPFPRQFAAGNPDVEETVSSPAA